MTTGAALPGPPALLRQALAVASYELRRLRGGRHGLVRAAFVLLPFGGAALGAVLTILTVPSAFSEPLMLPGQLPRPASAELANLATLLRWFTLPFVTYLATVDVFGNLFRAELAERTLHHLFLQPARREVVVLGKYLAGVAAVGSASVLTWFACACALLLPHGPRAAITTLLSGDGLALLFGGTLALVLATAAYGALFLLAGMLFRSPIVVAAAVFLWEWATAVLPQSFKDLTLIHYLDSLLPVHLTVDWALATVGTPSSVVLSVVVLLALAAACVALAGWRSRSLELSYGASE